MHAASLVFPDQASVLNLPKESVKKSATAATGPDMVCHAPCTVWLRLQRPGRSLKNGAHEPGAPVHIETVSEYGIRRTSVYHSAQELSRALVDTLSEEAHQPLRGAAGIRVRDDGALQITSQLHMRRQLATGRLQCATCGCFCIGDRGLRDHQQVLRTTTGAINSSCSHPQQQPPRTA